MALEEATCPSCLCLTLSETREDKGVGGGAGEHQLYLGDQAGGEEAVGQPAIQCKRKTFTFSQLLLTTEITTKQTQWNPTPEKSHTNLHSSVLHTHLSRVRPSVFYAESGCTHPSTC